MEPPRLSVRVRIGERGVPATALAELASAVEAAGADALFLNGERRGASANDPFVLLGVVAAATSRLGLGCMSSPIEERPPSILAKTLAALDLCSLGRTIACVTSDLWLGADPAGALVEEIAILRAMLEVTAPSFDGEHFSIRHAWNEPRAPRSSPMLIGIAIRPSERAGAPAAQMAVALAEHVDFVVQDARAMTPAGGIPTLAIVDGFAITDVKSATSLASLAGTAGVVLDFAEIPNTGVLCRTIALAKDL